MVSGSRSKVFLAGMFALSFFVAPHTQAARLLITPATGDYAASGTFPLAVRLETQGECINAGEIQLSYPKDLLEVVDVSRGESIFSLWVTNPIIRNEFGVVSFAGGVPNGYCGRVNGDPGLSNGLAKVFFRFTPAAAQSGQPVSADVTIGEAKVLLNDGLGTEAKITKKGAHVTLAKNGTSTNAWQQELKADTVLPEPFSVALYRDAQLFDNKYFTVFSTVDKQTGIDRYEVKEGSGSWEWATSPYIIRDQSLKSVVSIKAIDKAGNERIAQYTPGAELTPTPRKGKSVFYLLALSLAVIFIGLLRFIRFVP